MSISFVRIDDRVLHGQIVTRWSKLKPCKGILIIDDVIVNDPFQKKIFLNSAPNGVKVGIYDVKEGKEKIEKAQTVSNGYFVICKSPRTLVNLKKIGADFGDKINVGPMSARSNTLTVGRNCSLTEDEITAFEELANMGILVEFQLIPDEAPTSWETIKNKINKIR